MLRIVIVACLIFVNSLSAQDNKLLKINLESLKDITIKEIKPDSGYSAAFEIFITQPLDHTKPDYGIFEQKLKLQHKDYNKPIVLITEGYSMGSNWCGELAYLLDANELRAEYRYFGDSVPDTMDWQYLRIDNASDDYHKIVTTFSQLYKGKWITAGWSKGGQTTMLHKSKYPDDVAASVIYNSPLNFALEDVRIDNHFDTVGTKECRDKLIEFQRLALKNKTELLPLFKWYAKGKGMEFSVGLEKAFEYCVLEYPFSFWQYTEADCGNIPGNNATTDEILEHLKSVVSFSSYSDWSMNSPAMYQFSTQLGYYGYVQKYVQDLLSDTSYPNNAYAPQNTDLSYDPVPMHKLKSWLDENGNNMVYIYAEYDPWAAPQVMLSKKVNSKKYILPKGNHFTFIQNFNKETRKEIIKLIFEWIK